MRKTSKACTAPYSSPNQLTLAGFQTPFYNQLDPTNRWVVLGAQIPWDDLVSLYNKHNPPKQTGRPALSPRVLIGAVIIKHILNLDDRETVAQITENMYLQFFLGYSSYTKEPPFDASLFVGIRKRLGQELVAKMNERIYGFSMEKAAKKDKADIGGKKKSRDDPPPGGETENKGEVIYDATVCPQDISYPTDLGQLNKAREITEELIDPSPKTATGEQAKNLPELPGSLMVAQNKNPQKTIRKRDQVAAQYLGRNFKTIERQLDGFGSFRLNTKARRKY